MGAAGMEGGWRGPRRGTDRQPRWPAAIVLALAVVAGRALAAGPHGDDVHRSDSACETCHTTDAAALRKDPTAAKAALVPDLEERCARCHDEGPSHRTGIRPVRAEPPALPLAPDGTIGCATCHFMHHENDTFGDFLRLDNGHGGLCLSCHELSELQ